MQTGRSKRRQDHVDSGVPAELAGELADLDILVSAPDIVTVAERTNRTIGDAATTFFATEANFRLDRVITAARSMPASDNFERRPRATSTSGPTASTCRRVWRTRRNASWSSSAPRRRARRSCSASSTARARALTNGAPCCSISSAGVFSPSIAPLTRSRPRKEHWPRICWQPASPVLQAAGTWLAAHPEATRIRPSVEEISASGLITRQADGGGELARGSGQGLRSYAPRGC